MNRGWRVNGDMARGMRGWRVNGRMAWGMSVMVVMGGRVSRCGSRWVRGRVSRCNGRRVSMFVVLAAMVVGAWCNCVASMMVRWLSYDTLTLISKNSVGAE